MNYQETLQYLYDKLPMFQKVGGKAYKANLDNILALCEHLGNPQNSFKSVHIAGTNGKGSSSHFTASVLQEAGYKVGLTTSPHLKSFTERIRINGLEITESAVVEFVEKQKSIIETLQPSFFEVSIAMAFWYFAKQQVDIAVIEVGMGGRLDSTNIITPLVSLITNIGLDHQAFLGDTLPKIAHEKAGIIKPNVPVVISEQQEETQEVFLQKASQEKAPMFFAEDFYEHLQTEITHEGQAIFSILNKTTQQISHFASALVGKYQEKNILGVLKTLDVLQKNGFQISQTHIKRGFQNVLKNTHLLGRWQILSQKPLIIADTAHNTAGIKIITDELKKYLPTKKLHLVLGFVSDKDVASILALFPSQATYYFCEPNLERAMPAEKVAEIAHSLELQYLVIPEVSLALQTAQTYASENDVIFVGGSTFVVAEIV